METKGTVLVIDDEAPLLRIIEQFLTGRGYRVARAETGERALELIKERAFDIALVDLKLPDYTGLELIDFFNTSHPDMRCIIMTAYASLESTIEALRLNAFDYIRKPFDLVKIGEVVDAAFSDLLVKRENAHIIEHLELANKKLEESARDLNQQVLRANEELGEVNESLKKHVTRLKMLYQMGRDISTNENWSDALDRFLMALCNYLEANGAGLLLFSNDGKDLKVRTSYHLNEEFFQYAIPLLREAQQRDTLPSEIFHLESCATEKVQTCLEMTKVWEHTVIPLLYKGCWLGFIVIKKQYESRRSYLNDYHFITTIQTILTEEVANAVSISRLRNLKNFNETVLENINNGVLMTDRTGRIIFINSRAKEMLGDIRIGEIRFDDLFLNPFGKGSLFDYLISNEERNCSLEVVLTLPHHATIPIRLNTTIVELDDYHGRRVVAIFEDLTSQKAMEEKLRRADRMRSLGELSAGVAHEIRNPLTGIATTAQVLREKLADEAEKQKYITVILDEINRLEEIIRNLLTFARPLTPSASELLIRHVVEDSIKLLTDTAVERNVSIKFENELEDDHCLLDRDQIKQVVLNVALNGIQACSTGGELAVYLRDAEDPAFIQMEFADTGGGIPGDVADKLYNPFFTTRSEGTGLGLAITRKIVESHGGRIYHQSEGGKGTRFFVELPRKIVIPAGREEAAKVS